MARDPLQVNAWLDTERGGARAESSPRLADWAIRARDTLLPEQVLWAEEAPNLANWREAGWGVILADDPDLDDRTRADATDAPPAVRRLLDARPGCPVLRYRPELGSTYLMLCEPGNEPRQIATAGGEEGPGARRLPQYLLIVGPPTDVPWRFQYVLNATHFVGRLDLDPAGLDHYIDALLSDWSGSAANRRTVLTWAVDLGESDITWLMRHGLAERLHQKYLADPDVTSALHRAAGDATHDELVSALGTRPGIIVTTSHGATPIDAPTDSALRAALGRLVDQDGVLLTADMIGDHQPHGAIWYAHACCSAGSDASTLYGGMVTEGSDVDRVLTGVATRAGARSAPLPRELLGHPQPLRAFVGHVEPTFNWTLRDHITGQLLTPGLVKALYDSLYQEHAEPIGYALRHHFAPVGTLWSEWGISSGKVNAGKLDRVDDAVRTRLTALDRQSLVLLGDPTACLQ